MDTQLCEHKDQFIIDVKGLFTPLETNIPGTDTYGDNEENGMVFTHTEVTDNKVVDHNESHIGGTLEIPSFEVQFIKRTSNN